MVRVEKRIWSKGSARGAGPQVKSGTVRVNFDNRAADVPMCAHGIAMRRCDECGVFLASHPGVVPHVCGTASSSCADAGCSMNLEASGAQLMLPGAEAVTSPAKARRARPPATKLISTALKNAGPRGLLVEEIATHTHLPLSSVAARVGEMMRAYVVLPVERRASPRGRPAWAFALPQLLDSDARVAGRATAIHLVQHKGRWTGPVHSERATLRAVAIEAEGGAAVSAALKLAGEILGT